MAEKLKAPFPWFGGKSRVSNLVWERFGDVKVYVEPFAGSLAVLLGRPDSHKGRREIVNDFDAHICNLWRSVRYSPEEVIEAADYPINEPDLHAWHVWLVSWLTDERRERFMSDPSYHEPQVAGRWLWGICQWIGSGWCRQQAVSKDERGLTSVRTTRQMPDCATTGGGTRGVAKIPRKRPAISTLSNGAGFGVGIVPQKNDDEALSWTILIKALCERLRHVRVCCGDWKRIVTHPVLGYSVGTCGLFLDPPYGDMGRTSGLYSNDNLSISKEVLNWCAENGSIPNLRIALCGYEGEHNELDNLGWTKVEWKATGGYGSKKGKGLKNRNLERIWFSPECLDPQPVAQMEFWQ